MVPDGHLLFDHHAHDLASTRPGTGSLQPAAVRRRIGDFAAWGNREAAQLRDQADKHDRTRITTGTDAG